MVAMRMGALQELPRFTHAPFRRTYTTLEELCLDYELGLLHPGDLKKALALALNEMIQPVRPPALPPLSCCSTLVLSFGLLLCAAVESYVDVQTRSAIISRITSKRRSCLGR